MVLKMTSGGHRTPPSFDGREGSWCNTACERGGQRTWSGALQREARQVAGAVSNEAIGPLHGEAARACEAERAPGQLARKLGLWWVLLRAGSSDPSFARIARVAAPIFVAHANICAWDVRWARIARVCEPWGAPWLARLRRGAGAFTRRHGREIQMGGRQITVRF